MAFEHILTDTKNRTGIITLNRPKALNALCQALMDEEGRVGARKDRGLVDPVKTTALVVQRIAVSGGIQPGSADPDPVEIA